MAYAKSTKLENQKMELVVILQGKCGAGFVASSSQDRDVMIEKAILYHMIPWIYTVSVATAWYDQDQEINLEDSIVLIDLKSK